MPAKPLTAAQRGDAARLKEAFEAWQATRKAEKAPFSQEHAAAALGFNQSALSQYLRGAIPLNATVLWKFCELLGLAPEEISPDIAGRELERARKWREVAESDPGKTMVDSLAIEHFVSTTVSQPNMLVLSAKENAEEYALVLAYREILPEQRADAARELLAKGAEAKKYRQYFERMTGATRVVPDGEVEHLRGPAHTPPAPRSRTRIEEGSPAPAPKARRHK